MKIAFNEHRMLETVSAFSDSFNYCDNVIYNYICSVYGFLYLQIKGYVLIFDMHIQIPIYLWNSVFIYKHSRTQKGPKKLCMHH